MRITSVETSSKSHLAILFCTTAGEQGENLGADEHQVVHLVLIVYELTNNKVVEVQQYYIRPIHEDISEAFVTAECIQETQINEELVKNAQPLDVVLDELDRFLSLKEVHPEHSGKSICLCVDGSLPLRLCLHPEASNKNIPLLNYYYTYFDLRKEFKKFYKADVISIQSMLDFLNLDAAHSVEYGVQKAQDMANIVSRLVSDGHTFDEPEKIKERLEPGICAKSEQVDDETVIRARGLPWQSSDQDIARFFRGLNIARGGVALCLSPQGRRNGEALIRFETKEHRDLALRKHKHHLGQRYIEVYKASGKDFVNVAGGNSTEAQAFLSRHNGQGGQVIVRMRGLPYTSTAEQVLEFFRSGDKPVDVLDGSEGILFVYQADGRATGDAFVLFATEDEANQALTKHRETMGTRYIELFKSTTAEVQQVLNRSMDPRVPGDSEVQLPPLIQQLPPTPMILPQHIITSGSHRNCIRLRGLPYEANVSDIIIFLGEHSLNIINCGVHMIINNQGVSTGEAFIKMRDESSAESAAQNKHKKFMFIGQKRRYIEVLQCSGEEMHRVLTNGMPTVSAAGPAGGAVNTAVMSIHAAQAIQATHAQMFSPGATILPATTAAVPGAAAAAAAYGMYPYPQTAATAGGIAPMIAPAGLSTVPGMMSPALAQLPPHAGYSYQPIMYWYPSPPVSPQSSYFVHACPSTVVMKGLPFNISLQDCVNFFDGIFEMQPDIQIQRGPDGRPNGEAYVTFGSRSEAERAVTERNCKVLCNRFIELHMA